MIPVISLSRPWADWVANGWKTIETRTHKRFQSLRGKQIAIHASKTWDRNAIKLAEPYLSTQQIDESYMLPTEGGGTIICVAQVTDFYLLGQKDEDNALIECETERWGLVLEDIRKIKPVPCKGRQGVWYIEEGLLKR